MASAKTSTFYVRESFDVTTAGTPTTMDLSLYVDPVNRQGLLVRNVDFIWSSKTTFLPLPASAFQMATQVHDSVLGGMASYDSQHQVASGALVGTTSGLYASSDFFPDRLGMSKGEGRIIVNDTLEIVADSNVNVGNAQCTVVLECQVIKLSEKDYIALALQSVADA